MNPQDHKTHEERWIAYFLGELGAADRREVEAELKSSPSKAAEYESLIHGIEQWAREPVPYTPLRTESFARDGDTPADATKLRPRAPLLRTFRLRPWAWGLAAAALSLVVLLQAEFTFRIGKIDLRWGSSAENEPTIRLQEQVAQLTAQLSTLTQTVSSQDKLIRDVSYTASIQDAYLENQINNATSQLVRYVQSESQTRYEDFKSLMHIAGLGDPRTPEWMLDTPEGGLPANSSSSMNR